MRVKVRVGMGVGVGVGHELGEGLQSALARLARLLRLLDVGFEQRHEGVVDLAEGRA